MRTFILPVFAVAAFVAPAFAQQESTVIEGVIRDQISAFQADDFERAFTFASPMIRGLFGTSENFGRMVKQGYPMVWRPGELRFLGLDGVGSLRSQRVMITDQEGRVHILQYDMIPSADGWQINGVQIVKEELGA
ncbi:DUF4864 domain-containing protein [Actibacterium lipolyticum]|uniref:DUF4864 domain-containing protein n=1 Tax=Actibacterium lipolyticum TaxID=1524263 RepID=A0A238JLM7_9RHOB|nr:hypothetical protein COL8621_00506 [Actibacterium lipolyticum]